MRENVLNARGRPRSFDVEEALDRALLVFWRKGYEGASLPDLTKAMGISRPSLYAAFGNKESLFRKVLDRYTKGPAAYICKALEAPTAREVVERIFRGTLEAQTCPKNPRGCLMVQGALSCGDSAEPVRNELIARRKAGEKALRARLQRAESEGALPDDADPAALARYVLTVVQGMSIQAASGATRKDLQKVADMALRAWPTVRRSSVGGARKR